MSKAKKIVSFALCLVLILALSVPAFADSGVRIIRAEESILREPGMHGYCINGDNVRLRRSTSTANTNNVILILSKYTLVNVINYDVGTGADNNLTWSYISVTIDGNEYYGYVAQKYLYHY